MSNPTRDFGIAPKSATCKQSVNRCRFLLRIRKRLGYISTMKTNKEQVIEKYAEMIEKAAPGKGQMVSEIVSRNWTVEADRDAEAYLKLGAWMSVLKNMAVRNPAFAAEIKALKG